MWSRADRWRQWQRAKEKLAADHKGIQHHTDGPTCLCPVCTPPPSWFAIWKWRVPRWAWTIIVPGLLGGYLAFFVGGEWYLFELRYPEPATTIFFYAYLPIIIIRQIITSG